MKYPLLNTIFALTVLGGASMTWLACSDDSSVKDSPAPTTTTTVPPLPDAGLLADGGTKDCYDNPQTHFEIINGCVAANVTKYEKNPTLTKLLADGGLPPLP